MICERGSGMRLLISWLAGAALAVAGPWPAILESSGLPAGRVVVLGPSADGADALKKAEAGSFVVLQGDSKAAEAFGFRSGIQKITIRSVVDARAPKLPIIWKDPVETFRMVQPANAIIFAKERWTGAPVLAGMQVGHGAVLWLAASPGERGYERFPYLPQALVDLGLQPQIASRRLWAFFDSSYRMRVDLDYFAERWRKAGISALHVAAWHYNEPNAARDEYLRKLILACHKQAIVVYAWLELPHVSEQFWNDHPEWREKTALLQDAHLDWRKLMNLQNHDCFNAAAKSTRSLLQRFDWDGVNMAELYFESLEGISNPARFTPFNDDVRQDFLAWKEVDPIDIVNGKKPELLKEFLGFRAGLTRKMQKQWLDVVEDVRKGKPDLDVVLTHVDDRLDPRMRELIGADAAKTLPMLEERDFTFLIEDPATTWHLGPERYTQIASRYKPITRKPEKLAIDINIVERYQDVYPTKQQTGTELFELVHTAARAFPRVALYFENSLLPVDLGLLPSAAAVVERMEQNGSKLQVESQHGAAVRWPGEALVNGRPWPFCDSAWVTVPPGKWIIEPTDQGAPVRVLDFNGELTAAAMWASGVEFQYTSNSRAIALLDQVPATVKVDGKPATAETRLILPKGTHTVSIEAAPKLAGRK